MTKYVLGLFIVSNLLHILTRPLHY